MAINPMNLNNQNGFTIVQAIFILVVLALLGTYMVSLSTIGQATSTQAVMQARAYQAARAGLEWGIAPIANAGNYSLALIECNTIDAAPSFDVDGFTVDVTCDPSPLAPYNEGGEDIGIYNLNAVASYPSPGTLSSPDYVSRTLEVTIHD